MTAFNIYCDESCHLEHSRESIMVLGGLMCTDARRRQLAERIRSIKKAHGVSRDFEVKWTKVSPAKLEFYLALVDHFFQDPELRFRAVVIDKKLLDHERHDQTHEEFYYKMFYYLLRPLLAGGGEFRVYLDIHDTHGGKRVAELKRVFEKSFGDYERERIRTIQIVPSHEVQQVQLADLLIGATSYAARGEHGSAAKVAIVRRIEERSGIALTRTSSLWSRKLNVFVWTPGDRLVRG